MENEKYQLHNWERKEVYVKQKTDVVAQQLSEVILRLRELLISSKIKELAHQITQKEADERQEILENIQEYNKLKVLLSERLKTVVRRV